MSENKYQRRVRQFKSLSKKINHLLSTGKWLELSKSVQQRLILKLKHLIELLLQRLGIHEIKKILAAAAVLVGFGSNTNAQVFNPPVVNPFGIAPTYEYAYPDAVDIDNDGDLDLFVIEYYGAIKFFENTGSATSPQFALPQSSPFGLTPFYYFGFMDFADLDNDGDYDILGFEYDYDYVTYEYGNWRFIENTGTPENPQFGVEINDAFDLPSLGYYIGFPEFADIDDDGDQDLFVGEYYGNMVLFENIGTPENPVFDTEQYNPFGLTPNVYYPVPSFADLDLDNDLDLLVNIYEGEFRYYENTGTAQSPEFALPLVNPFGLNITDSIVTLIDCVDLDGDGDYDIIGGGIEYFAPIYYFKNDLITGVNDKFKEFEFFVGPNPSNEELRIQLDYSKLTESAFLELVNTNHKVIRSTKVNSAISIIKVSDIAAGVYFLNLYDGRLVKSQKVIIE